MQRALTFALESGMVGETYNVGGRNERINLHVVQSICDLLDEIGPSATGSRRNLIYLFANRPGHDRPYAIDAPKIDRELGWRAEENSRPASPRPCGGSAIIANCGRPSSVADTGKYASAWAEQDVFRRRGRLALAL